MTTFATLHTSKGDIRVELFEHQTPKTVRNFVGLAEGTIEWKHPETGVTSKEPLYDGVVFHRVIPQFMVQGGDPVGRGTGGPGYSFDDEIHSELVFDQPYLLAMANSGKRFGRGTNGSQFFITTAPTPWLQGKHTIFGRVVSGTEVVDAIEAVPTGSADRPLEDVTITSVSIERT